MRKIDKIILHCSDSSNPDHDDIKVIDGWHKQRGWSGCGYHFFIQADGNIQKGRPISSVGAHCHGFNKTSIGICLHGKNQFTGAQFNSLIGLCKDLILEFKLSKDRIYPHHHFNEGKTCPNFDVAKFIFDHF